MAFLVSEQLATGIRMPKRHVLEVFAVAGVGALVITLLMVSYQSIEAALEDPVNSFRSE